MGFSYLIINWYLKNMRDLPWRHTSDPYRIWVSEIILQQTRVNQGLSYYHRFLANFPDVESLAKAEEQDVMKTWQGLGYYSRARNMHQSAKDVVRDHGSRFPASYDELRKLKGIGDYSASAISSISNKEAHPVVDGNVLRVMSRYLGLDIPIQSSRAKKAVREYLTGQIDPDEPGTFNQALMEIGALICKPKLPMCRDCPVKGGCYAFTNGTVSKYPVIEKPKGLRVRFFYYLVIHSDNTFSTWIKKRTEKDIWKNLYDFPLIEMEKEYSIHELETTTAWKSLFMGSDAEIKGEIGSYRHLLSHQELRVTFIRVIANGFYDGQYLEVPISEIHKYPVPRLIENFLKKTGW